MAEQPDILFWPSKGAKGGDQREAIVIYDRHVRRNLSFALYGFICELENEIKGSGARIRPFLILTPRPTGRVEGGLSIPQEFVIGTDEMDRISERIKQLVAVHPRGVGVDQLRAMCVGAFRRALCMDDDNHRRGDMEPFDLTRVSKLSDWKTNPTDGQNGAFWPDHVINRINAIERRNGKPSDFGLTEAACQAFRVLFAQDLSSISIAMKAVKDASGRERLTAQTSPSSVD